MTYEPLKEFAQRVGEQVSESDVWAVWAVWEQCHTESDPERARQLLVRLLSRAEAGSKLAMCMCAARLRSGQGTLLRYKEAAMWARRAAESGYPPGIFELGRCYEDGVGIPQNLGRAIELYEEAAAAGYAHAALTMAIRYHLGQGVTVDPAKGLDYITRAVELGDAYAPFELATWYEHGSGVQVDLLLARHWYGVAADAGSLLACLRLSTAYSVGELGLKQDVEMARKYEELSRKCDAP